MTERNIIFDLLLLEADRILAHRQKDLDLYYKDIHGDIVPLGEAYKANVDELVNTLFKRKKMRYFISFSDSIDLQDELKPSSHKILRFFCKHMNYGNQLKGYGIRDIQIATSMNTNYVAKAISELCHNDLLRFDVTKGRRNYMVNPIYFYKGTMKKLFYCVKEYDKFPKRNADLEEEYQSKDNIF